MTRSSVPTALAPATEFDDHPRSSSQISTSKPSTSRSNCRVRECDPGVPPRSLRALPAIVPTVSAPPGGTAPPTASPRGYRRFVSPAIACASRTFCIFVGRTRRCEGCARRRRGSARWRACSCGPSQGRRPPRTNRASSAHAFAPSEIDDLAAGHHPHVIGVHGGGCLRRDFGDLLPCRQRLLRIVGADPDRRAGSELRRLAQRARLFEVEGEQSAYSSRRLLKWL